jgi:diadenosine tetraphosphate (Ap4A) HIT family hydrolase
VSDTLCVLCQDAGGVLLHRARGWRLVRTEDTPAHPVFYRLIWNHHVAEFSDLSAAERRDCMDAVARTEWALREALQAAGLPARKINLASLGNVVPHLHWHLVARFDADAQFPAPIWAPAVRPDDAAQLQRLRAALPALDAALAVAAAATPT